ncbi:hypothetical protein [Gehongia tenuis]|uniref:LPXTG cell wall anchor domain-containing protein n=1 Tax=Gehongia tenuis TaxID=2763655 RepID=A0A926D388_9FIRM|nr:hypothetical protein [Gehongia tenuis]MBC8530664.1 hypothetical protein [Gehongia tenuis]
MKKPVSMLLTSWILVLGTVPALAAPSAPSIAATGHNGMGWGLPAMLVLIAAALAVTVVLVVRRRKK